MKSEAINDDGTKFFDLLPHMIVKASKINPRCLVMIKLKDTAPERYLEQFSKPYWTELRHLLNEIKHIEFLDRVLVYQRTEVNNVDFKADYTVVSFENDDDLSLFILATNW